MISSPCKNCEDRHYKCHGECCKYNKYLEEKNKLNKKIEKEKMINDYFIGMTFMNSMRGVRRR